MFALKITFWPPGSAKVFDKTSGLLFTHPVICIRYFLLYNTYIFTHVPVSISGTGGVSFIPKDSSASWRSWKLNPRSSNRNITSHPVSQSCSRSPWDLFGPLSFATLFLKNFVLMMLKIDQLFFALTSAPVGSVSTNWDCIQSLGHGGAGAELQPDKGGEHPVVTCPS